MPTNLRLNTVLSFVLLTFISGCNARPPQAASLSSQPIVKPPVKQIVLTVPPENPDSVTSAKIEEYIKLLATESKTHGVWMQSGDRLLANHQGKTPLQAASITKVATTLVALQTLGPDHRFITQIGATGPIENGVLKGDLVIEGDEDPFFVWEEAIALGNTLNQMGIKQVTGNLIILGKFYMNFKADPQVAGNLLKVGLNSQIWTKQVAQQHQTLTPGTAKPQVKINGVVKFLPSPPSNIKPLIRHNSYPLAEVLKKMNQYSNNDMAEMLSNKVGGAAVVAKKAAEAAKVPQQEIQLFNGSGLTYKNRISPRAATAMFRAIETYLQGKNMTIADVFMVIGQDKGVLEERKLPQLAVVKSGSLDTVRSYLEQLCQRVGSSHSRTTRVNTQSVKTK
jgi:serine-type D-Ala-D-Ala carboxypeptidase/endopeptidase (penicillin-binding protein 4)